MSNIIKRLVYFRGILKNLIAINKNKKSMVGAILRALLVDFDRMFAIEELNNKTKVIPLIEKYCHSWPGCPICNSNMYEKNGQYGIFYGCAKYPDCNGIRNKDKKVTINDRTLQYIEERLYEEKEAKRKMSTSRFMNIDY